MLAFAVGPARQVINQVAPLIYKTALIQNRGQAAEVGETPRCAAQTPGGRTTSSADGRAGGDCISADPPPALIAAIQTDSTVLQASGTSLVSLSRVGGNAVAKGSVPATASASSVRQGSWFRRRTSQPGNGISWPRNFWK
jgi:hypothetical protein